MNNDSESTTSSPAPSSPAPNGKPSKENNSSQEVPTNAPTAAQIQGAKDMGDLAGLSEDEQLAGISPFEMGDDMVRRAQTNTHHLTPFNAGRGNPNWINTQARLAFAHLLTWAVGESQRTFSVGSMAGYIDSDHIAQRLQAYLTAHDDDASLFLQIAIEYCTRVLGLDENALAFEWANGAVGNHYPCPSRCLPNTEKIIAAYAGSVLFGGKEELVPHTHIFPTEGGTAAMCYTFKALQHNGLLQPGDKIALNTPIFTPYLEIPLLSRFSMVEIDVVSDEEENWQISAKELDKLLDPSIKAFFLVNPSNPGSHSLTPPVLNHLAEICKKRPDLMIVTDDVYATFVKDFSSVYAVCPYNTLLIYSFSKLYGVTGWRTGFIALNEHNVFDELIGRLPADEKERLAHDYSYISAKPDSLPFVDRLCMDSRDIGLYHVAGLSTPQQIFECLMCLTHLTTLEFDPYIILANKIVAGRYHDLCNALGIPEDDSPQNAKYYSLINIYKLARKHYGDGFRDWLAEDFDQVDFLRRLATEDGVVLLRGVGFDAQPGTLRISEANLPDTAYSQIGQRVLDILGQYYEAYRTAKNAAYDQEDEKKGI